MWGGRGAKVCRKTNNGSKGRPFVGGWLIVEERPFPEELSFVATNAETRRPGVAHVFSQHVLENIDLLQQMDHTPCAGNSKCGSIHASMFMHHVMEPHCVSLPKKSLPRVGQPRRKFTQRSVQRAMETENVVLFMGRHLQACAGKPTCGSTRGSLRHVLKYQDVRLPTGRCNMRRETHHVLIERLASPWPREPHCPIQPQP